MSLAQLMSLATPENLEYVKMWANAQTLTLQSSPVDVLPYLSLIGLKDESAVANLLAAAREVAVDPNMRIIDFVKEGGLMAVWTNQPLQPPSEELAILQCPHCKEMILP